MLQLGEQRRVALVPDSFITLNQCINTRVFIFNHKKKTCRFLLLIINTNAHVYVELKNHVLIGRKKKKKIA